MSQMFDQKTKTRVDAELEPKRKVHKIWKANDEAESWEPSRQHTYLGGSQGGTEASPAAHMLETARKDCTITNLFLKYATVNKIFKPMAKFTQYYACEEWVAPAVSSRPSSNRPPKKKMILKPCRATDPQKRHRLKFDKNREWKFNVGLMIAWHGSLVYHGGKAGERESPT